MTEKDAIEKATRLWSNKWRAYEIHRYLLNQGVERALVDKVVLAVTKVDFAGDDSYSYP